MPILDLQRQLRELGRIRMGAKTSKGAPRKLDTFRLTSASNDLLERAAAIYGGTVEQWLDAPGDGVQFELLTESDVLDAIVPPGSYLSQFYELWSGGGCQRRCDGETESLGDVPCLCPPTHEERSKLAAKGRACKITTRLSLILPNLPDIGVWRLESHGYYAAVELAGAQQVCAVATQRGQMVPVRLRLDQRQVRRPGQPVNKFAVPVLEVGATLGEIMGSLDAPTLAAPTEPGARVLPPADAETNVRVLREGVRLADGVARVEASQTLEPPARSSRQRSSAPMPGSPGLGDAAFGDDDGAPDLGPSVAPPAPPGDDDVEPEASDDVAVPSAVSTVAAPVARTDEAQAATSSPPVAAAEPTDSGSVAAPAPDAEPAKVLASRQQVVKLITLAERLGLDRNARLAKAGDVNSFNDLSTGEASRLIDDWATELGDEPPIDAPDVLPDDPVLNGGKHPGKSLSWLAENDAEYLRVIVEGRQLTPAGLAAAGEWLRRAEP